MRRCAEMTLHISEITGRHPHLIPLSRRRRKIFLPPFPPLSRNRQVCGLPFSSYVLVEIHVRTRGHNSPGMKEILPATLYCHRTMPWR